MKTNQIFKKFGGNQMYVCITQKKIKMCFNTFMCDAKNK